MASAGSFDIAKAGWLYRQSTVLHRWKKNWFVLDLQGDLRYFENPDTPRAEDRLVVRAVVTQIKTGPDCKRTDPPEGVSSAKACFLELCLREKESMLLCAETFDDMRAWQISLEEARTLHNQQQPPRGMPPAYGHPGVMNSTTIVAPPGYMMSSTPFSSYGYPGHVISQTPSQVIHSPTGTTTIVQAPPTQQIVYVDDGPYRRRRYPRGGCYVAPMFFW